MRIVLVISALLGGTWAGLHGQGFVDVTAQAGLSAVPAYAVPPLFGGGVCCGDFDGDDDLDLVLTGNPTDPVRYFANDGTGTFTDLTGSAGLGISGLATACVAADVDNDGDLDVCLARYHAACSLFINDGTGAFTDEAAARGVAFDSGTYAITFGDYDRDGWLDLYLGSYVTQTGAPGVNALYRNVGGGSFTDVTAAAGAVTSGLTFGATFMDYDEDGWPDLLVVNDKGYLYSPNEMWRNEGDGTFTEVGTLINVNASMDSMGVDFADTFNDGGVDFYVTDGPPEHLFQVWAGTAYNDATSQYGVAGGGFGWAVNFLDYDNDGWTDVHLVHDLGPNVMYRNPGAPAAALAPWSDMAAALGVDVSYRQFGVVVGDFDEDGKIDLLEPLAYLTASSNPPTGVMLLQNQVTAGNWLKVKTEGTVSNRDGIGARIAVTTAGNTQTQYVRTGVGFICGSDLRCQFGLGAASAAERVAITWPSGQVQVFENVAANQVLHAVEPRLSLSGSVQPGTVNALHLSVPGDGGLFSIMALALGTTPGLPLPSGRTIPLNLDFLALLTLDPSNPFLPQGTGFLSPMGETQSPLNIANLPSLTGFTFHAAALTANPVYPDGIKTILRPLSVTIN